MNKLKNYNEKRNFNKTTEPKGKTKPSEKNIFVVQHHLARADHYDFRLEWGGVLLSWAVPKGPSFNPKDKRLAVHVEDHPIDYADFEGVIPNGEYGAGPVMIWDSGYFTPVGDFDSGLKAGSLKFELFGKRLKGKWTLVKLKNSEEDNWLLIKENDKFKKTTSGIEKFTTSVKSNKTFDMILKNNTNKIPFKKVDVQLATLTETIPNGEYIYEVKYDGYRIVAFTENGKVKLQTRNFKDYTSKFAEIAQSLQQFFNTTNVVLDGEMVVLDEDGKSDFSKLQQYLKTKSGVLAYVIFDILFLNGKDLTVTPQLERKQILKEVLKNAPKNLIYSTHVKNNGKNCFKNACINGLEGVVAKKIDAPYIAKRNENWLKLKCYKRQEFVIGGYTKTNKKSTGLSALLVGFYDDGKLVFCGKVGTGFSEDEMLELTKKFKPKTIKSSPFFNKLPTNKTEQITYIKPEFVAEIQFAEFTPQNLLRQASFKGLRADKLPTDVVLESKKFLKLDKKIAKNKQNLAKNIKNNKKISKNSNSVTKNSQNKNEQEIEFKGIKITHPNKVLFKGVTKLDIVKYYDAVADKMLKFLSNRILSVVRCHSGEMDSCFFKKHPTTEIDGVKTIKLKNEDELYFYITNKQGLLGEVQLGTIEFHTWPSKVENVNKPDIMIFDLDPDKNLSLTLLRKGVKLVKNTLDKLKLKSFLKTSGGKGYHVVVPFKPNKDFDAFKKFAHDVALYLENLYPDLFTTNMSMKNRKNKIYIDYLRNAYGSTSVAPYSVRSRAGAKVSMPISWNELNKIAPGDIDIFTAIGRKNKNPWKNFFNTNQTLK